MGRTLSLLDRAALLAETGNVNMTIGILAFLQDDPSISHDAICDLVTERIHLFPKGMQRLHEHPAGLAHAAWEDDPHFDPRWHVRLAKLPKPGGHDELMRYIGVEMSRRLDRSRPLWEAHLIEGYEDGVIVCLLKTHHALVDGTSALGGLMEVLSNGTGVPNKPNAHTSDPAALHEAATEVDLDPTAQVPVHQTPTAFQPTLGDAIDVVRGIIKRRKPAPPTHFNYPVTTNRAYECTTLPLDKIKAVANRTGGTINDVVLALVAGALQRYLADGGTDPAAHEPTSLVPVSIRRENEVGGNRISVVVVELPVNEPDPLRRVEILNSRMEKLKSADGIMAGALLIVARGLVPPLLSKPFTTLLGLGIDFPTHNLVVSNIRGPANTLWVNESRVLDAYPVVPLNPENQGLNVGAVSYDGTVHFGFNADLALPVPIERFRKAFEAAAGDMFAATGLSEDPDVMR
ncbi:wax ester/triacylglycerol synthase family O-acyltransferase [Skermania sp. ID1734]|uniref:wax ester/triacylglycerol synthase family O-acyltransferase n=1 Tax=Skermania sp. ID1734 TaxID=2597516 RepID=UPI00163D7DD1|nr:wax ester/triacylglycerol synthase family O-acyltransferase [Skermania sp. ID1734]